MTPSPPPRPRPQHTHTPPRNVTTTYPIQASPFLMHAHEYALSLLSLGHRTCLSLSMCWSHASGQEFRMVPGLYTMYEVFKGERNISCKYILE